MKYIWIIIGVLLIGGAAAYYLLPDLFSVSTEAPTTNEEVLPVEPDGGIGDGAEPLPEEPAEETKEQVIGTSAGGEDIVAYHYGSGENEVLFIGGIHGGYSFDTALVGFELVDYLDEHPEDVPENVRVTVIPVLNPDGLMKTVGTSGMFDGSKVTTDDEARTPGRFNDNGVDLNRNFDCEWQSTGTWQNREVDGGSAPFSEPEAAAIRDYVSSHNIVGAVAYYAQAGGVYSSTCRNGILPATAELTNLYATAAGYPAYEEFDYYEITGDMVNWLASEKIPAISVLLTTHENSEWTKNLAGIKAVLNYFAE